MATSIQTQDHMTLQPVTVKADTPIFAAIQLLLDRSISGATVIDDEDRVIGVISEMDCLKAILSGVYHGEVGGKVSEIMTREVELGDPNAGILEIAQQLIAGHRRRIPVVRDGKFVGQYSCRSILRAVVQQADTPVVT